MANYNTYPNGEPIKRSGGANAASYPAHTSWVQTFDFSERTLGIGDTILEFMDLPANTLVQAVTMEVLTALPATCTVSIGHVGTTTVAAGFVSAGVASAPDTILGGGASIGLHDKAASMVTLLLNTAAAGSGKIRLTVAGVCLG
jgi:hypothetical protein